MTDTEELLDRAKAGLGIEPSEINQLVAALRSKTTVDDPYVAIQILGLSAGPELAWVVEPYLNSADDPMLARIALRVLCDDWGLGARYLHELMRFVDGVSWDVDEEVRTIAISTAGELLREIKGPDLGRRLLKLTRDPNELKETREWTLRALGRAVGIPHSDLPGLGVNLGEPLAAFIETQSELLFA